MANKMKNILIIIVAIVLVFAGLWSHQWYKGKTAPSVADTSVATIKEEVAYFAGGCFWCTESDYEKLEGVVEAISGYMGGTVENPSYNEVSSGTTGHREAVKVVYDPSQITYQQLAFELLRETDPTDEGGSFYDRGHQYTSAIYYKDEKEKQIAENVIAKVETAGVFDSPIVTAVEPVGTFWLAEKYHQDYYKKNSIQYKYYRNASGRDNFIELAWKGRKYKDFFNDNMNKKVNKWEDFVKPDDKTLRETLTPIQYEVTQKEGTERAFDNEYWDNHEEGIYVDIVSGEPLFSSTDKFDSGTGWPSFLKPLDYDFVTEHKDFKLIIPRTEIRSKYADSHLGHIILDGPVENDRIRYCMNSAALRFIPKENLEAEGLGEYLNLFE